MSKVLVLYYSAFGYVAVVANAIADGARSAGVEVDIKRVPGSESAGIAQHFGMIVVGPAYSATTIADATGQRHPSAFDLEGARQLGRLIALTAEKVSRKADSGAADGLPSGALAAAPSA